MINELFFFVKLNNSKEKYFCMNWWLDFGIYCSNKVGLEFCLLIKEKGGKYLINKVEIENIFLERKIN